MKKTLHFKTNTLLKNLVGKDLINDDNIAIVELVKNSYDAKSEGALVRFTGFTQGGVSTESSQIIIADTGVGMDMSDIEDKWLNIAYSEKMYLEQDKGAYLAGNKGIGRFSCDRLGEQLHLLTRKKGSELLHLPIYWPDFEIEGDKDLTIQDIKLEITSIDNEQAAKLSGFQKFPETGTVLVISTLRSKWNPDSLRDLKISLEKFLNPNQLFQRDQFRIDLSVPALEEAEMGKSYLERITGEIQNQIFEKLKFNTTYIEAEISADGETISVVLYHEGDKVFDLLERNDSYPLLGGVHIVVYYLNPYKKAYFTRQTGVRSVEFGSIFLFLNGFRIAPYGGRGDDWLGLDVRKTQGTQRYLSSRDVVGRIEILSKDNRFTPVSSREGLKNTEAFQQLRENFFLDVFRKLERFVVEGLHWDSVPDSIRQELNKGEGLDWENTSERYTESWERKKQRIVLSIMTLIGSSPERIIKFWFNPALLEEVYESRQEEVKRILVNIEGFEPGKVDTDLTKSLLKLRRLIAEKEEDARVAKAAAADLRVEVAEKEEQITGLEERTETYKAQTLFLQQATSLDVKQLMTYHHQISLDSTIVDNYIAKAVKALRNLPGSRDVLRYLQKAALANRRIGVIAQYATKANFRAATKKEPTDIPAFFEQYLLNVAKDFIAAGLNLQVFNTVNEPFELKASRIELSILIDNIISNASKAQARKLIVNIAKISQNTMRVSFIDDGKGLSKELPSIDSMFEMGITTTSGSGLGLYHVKNIVENMDGKISAIPLDPSGMEIRVEVTR
ncbi:MAG: sensor histidine kinase [Chloroflexota bacterium]